jgi:UDP-2-acetamido-3-amino-2,3-dideoxy-glucuronate N-acetyltransferase
MTAPDDVFVHPQGLCESQTVGPGTRVWAFAHVMPGAVVGADCNICEQCFVEGGATLGNNVTVKNGVQLWDKVQIDDDVFIGPNATFTNDLRPRAFLKRSSEELLPTRVSRGATIGANATVVCGVTIGEFAFIAAGAVVRSDVPDHAFMAGNPAVAKGWVCTCGHRLPASLTCDECGRTFRIGNATEGLVAHA